MLAVVVFVNMVVNIGVMRDGSGAAYCVPLPPSVDAMRLLNNVDLVVNVLSPLQMGPRHAHRTVRKG